MFFDASGGLGLRRQSKPLPVGKLLLERIYIVQRVGNEIHLLRFLPNDIGTHGVSEQL